MINRLSRIGVSMEDALKLRRIEMTLQRWGELECGNSNEHCSYMVERDEVTGKPFMVSISNRDGKRRQRPIPDREKGALKRANEIVSKYPDLIFYYQGDCRGCAVYLVPKKYVANGENIDSVYSRGFAVCD